MLAALVLAGSSGLGYSLPIAGAIAFLMLAVGVSYRQTIRAYPHGGGSYVVATDNLKSAQLKASAQGPNDLIDRLNLMNVVLVGHSTGGGEVAHYIGRHGSGRVSKLVLVGAVPPLISGDHARMATASAPADHAAVVVRMWAQPIAGVVEQSAAAAAPEPPKSFPPAAMSACA